MNTDSNEGRMKLYRTSSDSNGHANGSSLSPPEHRTDPLTYSDASTRGRDKARAKGPTCLGLGAVARSAAAVLCHEDHGRGVQRALRRAHVLQSGQDDIEGGGHTNGPNTRTLDTYSSGIMVSHTRFPLMPMQHLP